jgi:CO/xanthine dehydrogenase Mo-binding subunit
MSALEKELSRKTFVKGGGALIVGFSLLGSALAAKAQGADSPYASNGPYDQFQVDSWITINADDTASIKSGSISQGTGSTTGILQIAAEELGMDFGQVAHVKSDTNVTPETGTKAASNTITNAGPGVRAAAAWARQTLLGLASTQLGVPVSQLSVSKGVVSGGGKSVTYGQLLGGKLFNVRMPDSYNMTARGTGVFDFTGGIQPGVSPAKPVSEYTIVGTRVPSIEIPPIVTGAATFVQNVRIPGMLHGRVVLPRGQTVFGFGAPVVSVDEKSISRIKGARVVRRGDFLGVVAPQEYDAIQAAAQVKVKWGEPPKVLPGGGNEFAGMRALDDAGKTVPGVHDLLYQAPNIGNVDTALASAAHSVSETYLWPTNSHMPIGANCAIADVTPQGTHIFAGTQGVYKTRDAVAQVIGTPPSKVRVTTFDMGGTYGESQYDEAAQAAAIMSQLVGAPVRVQLMRWDEIGWDNTAPGTVMDIRAGIDATGNLVALDYSHIYPEYMDTTTKTPVQLAGGVTPKAETSGHFWPGPMYNVPNTRYLVKTIPLKGNWIKADWMRAGSSPHATFAIEQVVDELARTAAIDTVTFRRQNVTQGPMKDRLLAVLDAVIQAAGWQPQVGPPKLAGGDVVPGRGIAWSNVYGPAIQAAAIADVIVNKKTGKITVKHIYAAMSSGMSINPGLVENQLVGGVTQITSRLLTEQMRFSKSNVVSSDFASYPILRFKDAPLVTPILVQRMDLQPQGVGEPTTIAAPAAIANAFYDATGVRIRQAPLTPGRVRATLEAAGVK